MVTLRDVLTAPFKFRSESLVSDGGWSRVASYPELGCEARGEQMLDVIDDLEIQRVRHLVKAVADGVSIVPLRPPISDSGIDALLERAGLSDWIPRLDEELRQLASTEWGHSDGARSDSRD